MSEDSLRASMSAVAAFERLVPAGWRLALDSSPAPIGVTIGPRHLLAYQNLASQAMFGTRTLGLPLDEVFPELTEDDMAPMAQALQTGEAVDIPPRQVGVRDQIGDTLLMRYVLAPLGVPPEGVVMTAIDVTAETTAQRALARTRLLADLSSRMTAARDAGAALQEMTDALVPEIADVAGIYVVAGPDSDPTNPGASPLPPDVLTLSPLLAALGPPLPTRRDGPSPWGALIRSGTSIVIPVDEVTLPVLAPEPAAASWMRSAAASSIAVVPLVVAGTLSGAMVLFTVGDRTPFAESDLPFLEDVAARASAAIVQVRTVRQQQEIALGLQSTIADLRGLLARVGGNTNPGEVVADEDSRPALDRGDIEHGMPGGEVRGSVLQTFPVPDGLTVVGEVDASNARGLRDALLIATAASADRSFVVDLSGMDLIDVAGARALLAGTARYRHGGGAVRLLGVQSHIALVLRLAGVDSAGGVEGEPA
jgi:anti-anti-sigma factor